LAEGLHIDSTTPTTSPAAATLLRLFRCPSDPRGDAPAINVPVAGSVNDSLFPAQAAALGTTNFLPVSGTGVSGGDAGTFYYWGELVSSKPPADWNDDVQRGIFGIYTEPWFVRVTGNPLLGETCSFTSSCIGCYFLALVVYPDLTVIPADLRCTAAG